MDPQVKPELTGPLLVQIAAHFGLTPEALQLLGCWQNFVYRFERGGRGYILRVTHSSHRSVELIRSEADFVTYLADHGVHAARPVGEVYAAGDFTALVFEQAPGADPFAVADTWQVCRTLGRLTGQLHRLARDYRPAPGIARRFAWHENDFLRDFPRYVPAEQVGVHAAFRQLMAQLRALPTAEDGYGLIHGDLVADNFLWHEGQLHVFDFDEAQYGWFANDIAVPLFYAIPFPAEDRDESVRRFMDEFMAGYQCEYRLDPFWLKQMNLFLRLRELILYTALYRSADMNNLRPWAKRFVEFARPNLEHDEPFINYEFGA